MAFCPSRVRLAGWYGIIYSVTVCKLHAPVLVGVPYTVHVRVLFFEMPAGDGMCYVRGGLGVGWAGRAGVAVACWP